MITLGRCLGVEIRRLDNGFEVTVYRGTETQRGGPDIHAVHVVEGSNYEMTVGAALILVSDVLLLHPILEDGDGG